MVNDKSFKIEIIRYARRPQNGTVFSILKILYPNTIGVCAENELRLRILKTIIEIPFQVTV